MDLDAEAYSVSRSCCDAGRRDVRVLGGFTLSGASEASVYFVMVELVRLCFLGCTEDEMRVWSDYTPTSSLKAAGFRLWSEDSSWSGDRQF